MRVRVAEARARNAIRERKWSERSPFNARDLPSERLETSRSAFSVREFTADCRQCTDYTRADIKRALYLVYDAPGENSEPRSDECN